MIGRQIRKLWLLGAFMFALMYATSTGGHAAPSRSSLNRRLSTIERRKDAILNSLRTLKQAQASARKKLHDAKEALAEAESELRQAENKLEATRERIRRVKAELDNTENTLQAHRTLMKKRMVVTYKAGTPGYVEVLLNATDFDDFATRATYNKRMAEADTDLLERMREYIEKRDRQRKQLRAREQEEIALRKKVKEQRDRVAERKAKAETAYADAGAERKRAEQQLAAEQEASRQVEQMLAALARQRSGVGRYHGRFSGTLSWPCHGRISSPFGMRFHPILHVWKPHTGMDIAAASGTPITAPADGLVVHAGYHSSAYGYAVVIDHGSGLATLYGHCRAGSVCVVEGQQVSRGQRIARVGSTGLSTGAHLHFEVRRNGTPVNPRNYL